MPNPETTFPWTGRIQPWSAALRSLPHKSLHAPTQGILADVPRDTRVKVTGQHGGWLRIEVVLDGRRRHGYMSQELVEFISPGNPQKEKAAVQQAVSARSRLFFAIYYRVKDNAFKRAAQTWERETRKSFDFNDAVDQFISIEVATESEFKAAWKKVHSHATARGSLVVQGQIFSHASKSENGEQNGLEFLKDKSEDGTIKRGETGSLERLNWDPERGHLILSGCNSGLSGDRKWAPAQAFARSQRVRTTGQSGYAYFSTRPDTYVEIDDSSTTVYLWAFKRRRNGWAGDGSWMKGVTFYP